MQFVISIGLLAEGDPRNWRTSMADALKERNGLRLIRDEIRGMEMVPVEPDQGSGQRVD
jgi:hypothetical protein